jgi:hypothetical protein
VPQPARRSRPEGARGSAREHRGHPGHLVSASVSTCKCSLGKRDKYQPRSRASSCACTEVQMRMMARRAARARGRSGQFGTVSRWAPTIPFRRSEVLYRRLAAADGALLVARDLQSESNTRGHRSSSSRRRVLPRWSLNARGYATPSAPTWVAAWSQS